MIFVLCLADVSSATSVLSVPGDVALRLTVELTIYPSDTSCKYFYVINITKQKSGFRRSLISIIGIRLPPFPWLVAT